MKLFKKTFSNIAAILLLIIFISLLPGKSIAATESAAASKLMQQIERVEETRDFLRGKIKEKPEALIVLGSGLAEVAEIMDVETVIKYSDIPNWPQSTAPGHQGRLLFGKICGHPVAIMQGRLHLYEGHTILDVVFPIRVLAGLGVKTLIATNASGGIPSKEKDIKPGTIVIVTDHINLMGYNPLIGANNVKWGVRFPDMTNAYDKEYVKILERVAKEQNIDVCEGVYLGLTGPNYETPAEIRMARVIGADCVGMSTVPEVIAARHLGMRVAAISAVSNYAAGLSGGEINDEQIKVVFAQNAGKLAKLLKGFFEAK